MDHAEKWVRMEAHMTRLGIPKFVHSPPMFKFWQQAGVPMVPPLFVRFWSMVAILLVSFGAAALILWFKEPGAAVFALYAGVPIAFIVPAIYRWIARRHGLPLWADYAGDGTELPSQAVEKIRKFKAKQADALKPLGLKEKVYGVLGLALLALFVHMNLVWSIGDEVENLLAYAAETTEGSYRKVSYSLDGSVEATDLEIAPGNAPAGSAPARIGRVSMKTPGLIWMLRAGTPFEDAYPATKSLSIRIENAEWANWGMGRLVPALAWIGPYSGAVFEAAGCESNEWFSRAELAQAFGATEPGGTIQIDFEVAGPRTLVQRSTFGDSGGSLARQEIEYSLAEDAEDFLESDTETWRTTRERWTIEDQGFVRKRNRHCAGESNISESEFIDRHVASVQRLLLADGFIADSAVIAAYRSFVQDGGKLVWETRLRSGQAVEDFDENSVLPSILSVNDTLRVAYSGRFVDPVALPALGSQRSLVAVLRHEGTLPPAAIGTSAVASTVAAQNTRAPPSRTSGAEPQPTPARPDTVALNPPQGPGQPAAVGVPRVERLTVRDLPRRVGRAVLVTLRSGRAHQGYVESATGSAVRLKVTRRGGSATLTFARDQIASVEAIGQ